MLSSKYTEFSSPAEYHELFLEEAKLLRKVPKSLQTEFEYYTVYRNAIQYKYGIYEMPLNLMILILSLMIIKNTLCIF